MSFTFQAITAVQLQSVCAGEVLPQTFFKGQVKSRYQIDGCIRFELLDAFGPNTNTEFPRTRDVFIFVDFPAGEENMETLSTIARGDVVVVRGLKVMERHDNKPMITPIADVLRVEKTLEGDRSLHIIGARESAITQVPTPTRVPIYTVPTYELKHRSVATHTSTTTTNQKTYHTIRQIKGMPQREDLVNVYGVVSFLRSREKIERTGDTMLQFSLIDETVERPLWDNNALKVILFFKNPREMPNADLKKGDVIRFHRAKLSWYHGQPQLQKSQKAFQWVHWPVPLPKPNTDSSPTATPYCGAKPEHTPILKANLCDFDQVRVRQLVELYHGSSTSIPARAHDIQCEGGKNRPSVGQDDESFDDDDRLDEDIELLGPLYDQPQLQTIPQRNVDTCQTNGGSNMGTTCAFRQPQPQTSTLNLGRSSTCVPLRFTEVRALEENMIAHMILQIVYPAKPPPPAVTNYFVSNLYAWDGTCYSHSTLAQNLRHTIIHLPVYKTHFSVANALTSGDWVLVTSGDIKYDINKKRYKCAIHDRANAGITKLSEDDPRVQAILKRIVDDNVQFPGIEDDPAITTAGFHGVRFTSIRDVRACSQVNNKFKVKGKAKSVVSNGLDSVHWICNACQKSYSYNRSARVTSLKCTMCGKDCRLDILFKIELQDITGSIDILVAGKHAKTFLCIGPGDDLISRLTEIERLKKDVIIECCIQSYEVSGCRIYAMFQTVLLCGQGKL
eukprot:CFRG1205T1